MSHEEMNTLSLLEQPVPCDPLARMPKGEVKLNIGCGINLAEGYLNIDVQEATGGVKPDLFADAMDIPLPDGCADEVMAIHVFEHFYRWDVEKVLAEWRRLLKVKGRLVLEMPDAIKCARNVFEGIEGRKHVDQLGLWGLYGDPGEKNPYMVHKWGWTPKSITELVASNGFHTVRVGPTQYHAIGRQQRDMRVEAIKS